MLSKSRNDAVCTSIETTLRVHVSFSEKNIISIQKVIVRVCDISYLPWI